MRAPHLELLARVEPVERRRPLGVDHGECRSGRSEPSGPAITPHASSGWSARAWATMASTRSARITSTAGAPVSRSVGTERSRQHVAVGRYSGDRLGGQHADQHRTGQAVGRGRADRRDQRGLRRHRRRRVGRTVPPRSAPVASANTVSPSSGVCAGRMVRASPSCAAIGERGGTRRGSARRRWRPRRSWCSAG